MLEKGIRANLQFSGTGETKGLSLVFLCSRAPRAPLGHKPAPSKTTCPFVMHFVRKSSLLERDKPINCKQKKKHVTLSEDQIDEFDNEDFVFRAPVKILRGNEDDSQYFESLDELGFKLQNSDRPILFNIVNMNAGPPSTVPNRIGGQENGQEQSSNQNSSAADGVNFLHPLNKFSRMLEDMVIEDDPYFLQKFRSIHNHDLDSNLIENFDLI